MTTLMINLPHHSTPYPLGMAYVAGHLTQGVVGFDAFWWSGHLRKEDPDASNEKIDATIEQMMKDLIIREKPRIIGFTFHRFSDRDENWLKKIKSWSKDSFLVGGGGLVSVPDHREKVLGSTVLDAIACGEGEETARELEEVLTRGNLGQLRDIANLVYKDGDKIVTNAQRKFTETVEQFWADRSIFPGLGMKEDAYEEIALYTSRGCFWNCSFCSVTNLAGEYGVRKRRAQSPERIIEELDRLSAVRKIDAINIFDDDFLGTSVRDYERAADMFQSMKKFDGLHKIIFEATPRGIVTSHEKTVRLWETLQELRDMGKEVEISIGVESMSDRVLKRMGKKTNTTINAQAVSIVRQYGSDTSSFNYIMYLDDQMSKEELKESIDGFYPILAQLPASGHKPLMNKTMIPTAGSDSFHGLVKRQNIQKYELPVVIDGQKTFTTYQFQDPTVAKAYVLIEHFKDDLDKLHAKGVDIRELLFMIIDNADTLDIPASEIYAVAAYYDLHFKRGFMRRLKGSEVTKKVEAAIQAAMS